MEITKFLETHREPMPIWLSDFKSESDFDRTAFFQSRVIYYPGHGGDGHPIKLFGGSHSAHCFLMVDSHFTESQLVNTLDSEQTTFRGYHSLFRRKLKQTEVQPAAWTPHVSAPNHSFARPSIQPFGLLEILERNGTLDDAHGPVRLAILFLGADGHATFDALFCQADGTPPPFGILLQDHGFGGNYSPFGAGGVMHGLATQMGVKPTWLLVAENTECWGGYRRVQGTDGEPGGMAAHVRSLFVKKDQ